LIKKSCWTLNSSHTAVVLSSCKFKINKSTFKVDKSD
jgi:hypothetical protein